MGNGYRPYSAWNYQYNARSNAQALYGYGQTVQKLPPETAREHVTEIKKNVAAAKKEVGKLGDEAAKKADLKEHIDAMVKHYEAAEKMCAMMEKAIGDSVDNETVCDCCRIVDDELKAAEAEHQKVLDKLGIALPGPVSESSKGDSAKDAPVKGAKK